MNLLAMDANLLLYAYSQASPWHAEARAFLEGVATREDVAISEMVLVEFYTLLRNPAVLVKPLGAAESVGVIQSYRQHPNWVLLGFDPDTVGLHDELWKLASGRRFGRRQIYDARLALALRRQGVSEFATANVKHFDGLGFQRVWNPVA